MRTDAPLGILGGTLDPIHLGHLAAAEAARSALRLTRVLLVPSRTPPHRPVEPRASSWHRMAMTALAIEDHPSLNVSDLEVRREGPSYTTRTLVELQHDGTPASQLFFIIGTDAFAEIATWFNFPALLEQCHFVVISRPGFDADALVQLPDVVRRRMMPPGTGPGALAARQTGIFTVETSTPDVSSTVIRTRAAAGQSLEGMVPPRVEEYIRRHGLYRPATSQPASRLQ